MAEILGRVQGGDEWKKPCGSVLCGKYPKVIMRNVPDKCVSPRVRAQSQKKCKKVLAVFHCFDYTVGKERKERSNNT